MKKIFYYFLQGLLYTVPLVVTVYILFKLFQIADSLPLEKIIKYNIPGLSLVILFISITLIGFFGKYFITAPISTVFNNIIEKAPLIKVIYSSVKDLTSAFVGKEKKFDKPVLVKVSKIYDIEKVGFITSNDLTKIGVEGNKVAVYFPHSYAISGELFIVPAECISVINAAPSEVMKFIVSGGVTNINK